MKRYLFLTSVLALAACGGGHHSHHGGGTFVPGDVDVPSEITQANREVTVLPTSVDNRSDIVAYVESKLGPDYYDYGTQDVNMPRTSTTRGATERAGARTLTLDEKYAQAREKLDAMNKTLNEMFNLSNVSDFITENTARVVEALKLAGIIDTDSVPENVEKIEEAFEQVNDDVLDKVNDATALKEQTIEDITFRTATYDWDDPKDTGGIKVKLDDNGKIAKAMIVGVDDDADIIMERVGDTSKFKANTWYYYEFSGVEGAEVESANKLTLDEMKQKFKEAVSESCAANPNCDDGMIQDAFAKIDALTEEDRASDREDNGGFIEVEKNLTVGINTLGKELGMKYADFGYFRGEYGEKIGNKSDSEEIIEGLAGGYDVKRIESDQMSGEMVFAGRAVGGVYYELTTEDADGNERSVSGSKFLDTDEAKLTFNDGAETLNMNFAKDGWYNVTVTAQDGKSNIKFDGESVDKNYAFINTQIDDFASSDGQYGNDGQNTHWNLHGKYHAEYYGDNGTASEATAIVGVTEDSFVTDPNNRADHQVEFGAAFGGIKK